jgi:uncharacterized protein (DUF2141 family)
LVRACYSAVNDVCQPQPYLQSSYRPCAAPPVVGFDAGIYSAPALSDVDGDGDLDLVSGEHGGTFVYWENTGTTTSPSFVQLTGGNNPLDGFSVGAYGSAPVFADLDGDADFDLVAGEEYGMFVYWENMGAPGFVQRTGNANPLDGFDMGFNATPVFADVDFDGDFDLVSGEYNGTLRLLENTTPISNPSFVEITGAENPLDGFSTTGGYAAPVHADLDGDGDFDLVSGDGPSGGVFLYFENTGCAASPVFAERTGAFTPLDGLAIGSYTTPTLVDFDGDGDIDLASGEDAGSFFYFENTGSALIPAFVQREGLANPLFALSAGLSSTPTLADFDGDGDLDLVSRESTGTLLYYRNVPEPEGWIGLAAGSAVLAFLDRKRRRPALKR